MWRLPILNAILNSASAVFLILAYYFIRQGRSWWRWHRASILTALTCSALFLTSYLFYHYQVGHVPYGGIGWIRGLYFSILISHTILAMVALPMIIATINYAWRESPKHPKLGRITLALWLYVSITGVIVFLMLQPYAVIHSQKLQTNLHSIPSHNEFVFAPMGGA